MCWDAAPSSPIRLVDVAAATPLVIDRLDRNFFRVRFDRLVPAEQRYLCAMAALGGGPHRAEDISARLGVKPASAAPLRSRLIRKGMIYAERESLTAFTVPAFDAFVRRQVPEAE